MAHAGPYGLVRAARAKRCMAIARETRPRWARCEGQQQMTIDAEAGLNGTRAVNVVAFEQRERPPVVTCEFRLDETTYGLEMTLCDAEGGIVATLEYALASKPSDFDLDRLVEAWTRWRGTSAAAS
jgi:hypothetical protein